MAVHCGVLCPQKVLYPVCTSCCHCLVYDAFTKRIRGQQLAQAGAPPVVAREPIYPSEDFDQVYEEVKEPEDRFHIIELDLAVYITGTTLLIACILGIAMKKGAL